MSEDTRSPWGEQSKPVTNLDSIMREEGVEADSKFAQELHQKLSLASFPSASAIVKQPTEPCTDAADTDEQFARRLHEELNRGEDTSNDVLLAAMLQNEIDSGNLAAENHRNGNCKVTMSSFGGIPRQLEEYEELSEMEENSYFEALPEESIGKSKTKHDAELASARRHNRIVDKFHLELNTGDFQDLRVPQKVYNALQVEAHKSKHAGVRVKDRRDISTHEKVLDRRTRILLLKMVNSGLIKQVNGIVSTGKESVIIHCNGGSLPTKGKVVAAPVPAECVLKIHKTTLNEFCRRREYIDHRYSAINKTKKLIDVWALKEVHNLNRLRRAGVMCPEVVAHRKQILLLSFIGINGVPAQTLKEAVLSSDQLKSAYQQLLAGMKTIHSKCLLVHADLSEYNLLWYGGALHFIDLSQAVLVTHPSALSYLYRDCIAMHKYFKNRGLKNLMTPKEIFCHVSDMEVKYDDETSFINQIENLQRTELHDFKHGNGSQHAAPLCGSSDFAFETSFNASLELSDSESVDSESEQDEEFEQKDCEEISEECEENNNLAKSNVVEASC